MYLKKHGISCSFHPAAKEIRLLELQYGSKLKDMFQLPPI